MSPPYKISKLYNYIDYYYIINDILA